MNCPFDNVIAGVVCSISNLCIYDHIIPISAICDKLGITQSTINDQVKTKIFEKYKIGGFVGLIKSSGILVKLLRKWEL